MKKNLSRNKAVSAVIGVILMVAITVALAAAVYVYINGMKDHTPNEERTINGTIIGLLDRGSSYTLFFDSGENITLSNISSQDFLFLVSTVDHPVTVSYEVVKHFGTVDRYDYTGCIIRG